MSEWLGRGNDKAGWAGAHLSSQRTGGMGRVSVNEDRLDMVSSNSQCYIERACLKNQQNRTKNQ